MMTRSLTQIIHDMVLDGGVPAKVIAAEIGKPYTTMLREINPHDSGAKVGIDLLLPLMRSSKSNEPLKFLAHQMGYALVPLKRSEAMQMDPMAMSLKLLQEFGELSKRLQGILSQQSLSEEDFAVVEHAGCNAVMATVDLLECLRGMCGIESPLASKEAA